MDQATRFSVEKVMRSKRSVKGYALCAFVATSVLACVAHRPFSVSQDDAGSGGVTGSAGAGGAAATGGRGGVGGRGGNGGAVAGTGGTGAPAAGGRDGGAADAMPTGTGGAAPGSGGSTGAGGANGAGGRGAGGGAGVSGTGGRTGSGGTGSGGTGSGGTGSGGRTGTGGTGIGGTGSGAGGAGGIPVCDPPPAPGCCGVDAQCSGGITDECAGAICATSHVSLGVCKARLPSDSGHCWTDADCPDGAICTGQLICPCDSVCILPDMMGDCAI
jgi:hypothetical protein